MNDTAAPPASRATAAKTMADIVGLGGRHVKAYTPDKPLAEMTPEELESALSAVIDSDSGTLAKR